MVVEKQNSLYREPYAVTVAELVYDYLGSVKETMKPSTYAMYENYALNEVVPKIGSMDAAEFDRKGMETFLEHCLYSRDGKTRRSRNTMYAIEEVLRALFQHGTQKGLIPEVSLGKVKYGRQKSENDTVILSKWEIQGLLYEARQMGTAQELQVMLPLYLGLNLSELSGLKWEDVNLTSKSIHIHRCLKRIMKTETDGRTSTSIIVYELDKREQRVFRIPKSVCEVLEKAFYGMPCQDGAWFVSSLDYKYIEGRTLQYRLKNLGNKTEIKNLSYRCLRDTFAVTSLRAGASVMTLANILGVKMQVVCDRYRDWMQYDDRFLDKLE